jgi:putative transposase
MEYRKQVHATYYADYHLVFVTRYCGKILKDGMGEYLRAGMEGVVRIFPEVEILQQNTDEDHIHQLVSIPPKYAVADIVKYLKGKSAYVMRRTLPFLDELYYGADGI